MNGEGYEKEIATWRQSLDKTLRKENSWLALAGLFWLHEGQNSFGSHADNDIILPGSFPDMIGHFEFHANGLTYLNVTSDFPVKVNGSLETHTRIRPDTSREVSTIDVGNVRLMVIKRGERYAVRLWDNDRKARKTYPGRVWYPVNREFNLQAGFTAYEHAVLVPLPSASGDVQVMPAVGKVEFQINHQDVQLEAFQGPMDGLFIPFRDQTNGTETYIGGRYLTTPPPEKNRVTLDFNRAFNPPCAFTDFATCALPPGQNILDAVIPAGEQYREL